ncbi:MAG: site-specific integrase [Trueperaceae bacterium]|nr:site-specific integrase [Trueperaceae bacterium]
MRPEIEVARSTDTLARAESWAALPPEELKRRAASAAANRDAEQLWALTEAYLFLHGSRGAKVSRHTLRTYRRGVLDLVEAWAGENLLRPSRDAGVVYMRRLEAGPPPAALQPAKTKRAPDDAKDEPLSPASLQVKLAAARTLYKALRWAGATEARPFDDVRVAKDPTPAWEKRRPYSDDEVEALLEFADPAEKVVVLLGAHAGLRISEMTDLGWTDLDLERGQLRVRSGKGGKAATVSLTKRLRDALSDLRLVDMSGQNGKNRQRDSGLVLPWAADHARRRFKRVCALAGVEYASAGVHGLRHGAGTRYYRQTGDLGRVAAHLRHADIQTTRIYAKISAQSIGEDIEDW